MKLLKVGHAAMEELVLDLMNNGEPFFSLQPLPPNGAGFLKICLGKQCFTDLLSAFYLTKVSMVSSGNASNLAHSFYLLVY